jgi:hypothetical protein
MVRLARCRELKGGQGYQGSDGRNPRVKRSHRNRILPKLMLGEVAVWTGRKPKSGQTSLPDRRIYQAVPEFYTITSLLPYFPRSGIIITTIFLPI